MNKLTRICALLGAFMVISSLSSVVLAKEVCGDAI